MQREPRLEGFSTGVYDPHWADAVAQGYIRDGVLLDDFPVDSSEPMERDNLAAQYDTDGQLGPAAGCFYYSSIEQVRDLRGRLSTMWEPWLCQRLDALIPRMTVEMGITHKLTHAGLDAFCQARPGYRAISVTADQPSFSVSAYPPHGTGVFSVLQVECGKSLL